MAALNIPGFYYDEEKKKYFKIQANHSANGPKYTHETIKRETNEKKKRKRDQQHHAIQTKERVQRSNLRGWSSMSVVELQRQSGHLSVRNSLAQYQIKSFAKQLGCAPLMRLRTYSTKMFDLPSFDGYYLVCLESTTGGAIEHTVGMISEGGPYVDEKVVMLNKITSGPPLISLNLSRDSQILLTTTQHGQCNRGFRIFIDDLTKWDPYVRLWDNQLWENSYTEAVPPRTLINETGKVSLFSVDPIFVPGSSNIRMLFGTNCGIDCIDISPNYSPENPKSSWRQTTSDVLCVKWLTPQTAAFGARCGMVGLYDDRDPGQIESFRLPSASTPFKLCRTDDPMRIIVSSLSNHLAMYDMRMLRGRATRPLVKYNHSNKYTFPLGLDVHQESGLMAAGDDRGNINTYSIGTGDIVRTFTPSELGSNEEFVIRGDTVPFIRFKDGHMTSPSILAAAGGGIIECRL